MAFQDHNKGPEVLAVFGTGTALASIAVILRLWVRARILRKIGADDWIMAISLVLVYASLSCIAVSVHHGLGRHREFLAPKETSTALKFLWVGFCFTPSAEATAKISISIMLMRITTSAKWKRFFISLITLMMMITVAGLLVILLSCWHVELLRDPTLNDHCETLPRTVIIYIQGVMAAGYDIILASSPIFLLWKVKINFYDKTLLCGLLGLGFFTSATGIVRTVYTPGATRGEDATYTILDFLIWKCVELPLSIIVGCLPTLRPLFNRSKLDRSYQKQEDSYGLTNRGIDQRIRKTTTIDLDVDAVSSDNSHSVENSAWDVEARG